jgi:Na+-driven multidrug efflux pump
MVGNRIGAGEEQRAFHFAGRSLLLAVLIGLLLGSQVWLWSGYILAIYKVDAAVLEDARRVLLIISGLLWMRAFNSVNVVGVLRSGGDARFSFFLDGLIIWTVGVPMAFISAFVFGLPVYYVYLSVMSEEFLKFILGLRRYFSRKWIHNLAHTV